MELERFIEEVMADTSVDEVMNEKGIDFEAAERFLIENPKYVNSIPFPGDDPTFDKFMKDRNPGAVALQEIINRFDDPISLDEWDQA
jgi:hypothetical protein